jgi:hypothetical protein
MGNFAQKSFPIEDFSGLWLDTDLATAWDSART